MSILARPTLVLVCALFITAVNALGWYTELRRQNYQADLESMVETEARRNGIEDQALISRMARDISHERFPRKPAFIVINIIGSVFAIFQWWLAWYVADK